VGLLTVLGALLFTRKTRGGTDGGRADGRRPPQLELDLAAPAPPAPAPPAATRPAAAPPAPARPTPAEAEALLADLRRLGLKGIDRLRFTRNRTVMVSYSHGELRVHEGYRDAPPDVRRAVAAFVCGRTKADRRRAREAILAYQIPRAALPARRRPRPHPEDEPAVAQLRRFHAHYNRAYFGGRLRLVPIRLSARMVTRLGHYTAASPAGDLAEIVIGREHIRRHGWEEALHTLLHEMVHQWQDESGHPIDHGATFRRKAREVGITPSARRHVVPLKRARPAPPPAAVTIGLRAARQE
jgi:hypothetical protein